MLSVQPVSGTCRTVAHIHHCLTIQVGVQLISQGKHALDATIAGHTFMMNSQANAFAGITDPCCDGHTPVW